MNEGMFYMKKSQFHNLVKGEWIRVFSAGKFEGEGCFLHTYVTNDHSFFVGKMR